MIGFIHDIMTHDTRRPLFALLSSCAPLKRAMSRDAEPKCVCVIGGNSGGGPPRSASAPFGPDPLDCVCPVHKVCVVPAYTSIPLVTWGEKIDFAAAAAAECACGQCDACGLRTAIVEFCEALHVEPQRAWQVMQQLLGEHALRELPDPVFNLVLRCCRWPAKTTLWCFWHHGPILGRPCPVPFARMRPFSPVWTISGVCCSWQCAMAYLRTHNDPLHFREAAAALQEWYRKSGGSGRLAPAMDWRLQSNYSAGPPSQTVNSMDWSYFTAVEATPLAACVIPNVNWYDLVRRDCGLAVRAGGMDVRQVVMADMQQRFASHAEKLGLTREPAQRKERAAGRISDRTRRRQADSSRRKQHRQQAQITARQPLRHISDAEAEAHRAAAAEGKAATTTTTTDGGAKEPHTVTAAAAAERGGGHPYSFLFG